MTLSEKISKVKELNDLIERQAKYPVYKRMDSTEFLKVSNEINALDIQIRAEESLQKGEWRKDVKEANQLRQQTKTNRYKI